MSDVFKALVVDKSETDFTSVVKNISFNDLQFQNASILILVTLSGISILVSEVQSSNAE